MNALLSSPDSGFTAGRDGVPAKARDRRLRKHADYQRVYKSARKQFSSSMSWFLAQRDAESSGPAKDDTMQVLDAGPRVGLTVGKVLGKAHDRNRIKRRMREVVRRHVGVLPGGVDLVLHPKHSVLTMEFAKLEAEVLRIFRQAATQFAAREQAPGQGKTRANA